MNEDRISFDNNVECGLKYSLPSCVSVEDLMKNKVGITIVLNNMNTQAKQIQRLTVELEDLKCSRMSLPQSIFLAIVNIIGTVLIAVGVNFFTSNMYLAFSIILIIFGIVLVLASCLLPIIHPWYAKRENKSKMKNN